MSIKRTKSNWKNQILAGLRTEDKRRSDKHDGANVLPWEKKINKKLALLPVMLIKHLGIEFREIGEAREGWRE